MVTINNNNFSIAQIWDSGQCFRMKPIGENTYELIASGRYLKMEEIRQEAKIETICFCTEDEFETFWKHYFDLENDYRKYIEGIDKNDKYLLEAAAYGSGIHILRQDLWEMIISFIISQQNNIRRIRNIIQLLSERYGKKCIAEDNTVYYTFPEPEVLSEVSEEELRNCNLGYRSKYIVKTAKSIVEKEVDLEKIGKMNYIEARKELMKLYGVGGKVADCICLFALHHLEAFPIDTHIKQVLDTNYKQGFPFEKYKGYEGVIQQYIFYFHYSSMGKK